MWAILYPHTKHFPAEIIWHALLRHVLPDLGDKVSISSKEAQIPRQRPQGKTFRPADELHGTQQPLIWMNLFGGPCAWVRGQFAGNCLSLFLSLPVSRAESCRARLLIAQARHLENGLDALFVDFSSSFPRRFSFRTLLVLF